MKETINSPEKVLCKDTWALFPHFKSFLCAGRMRRLEKER